MIVQINKERCKGCGLCASFCPKKVIEISKETNETGYNFAMPKNQEKCSGCCCCAVVCADACIEISTCG